MKAHSVSSKNMIMNITYRWFYLANLPPYMEVIPNPKMAFIFPISCILALILPFL